jgi:hypothetical protein
MRDSLAHATDPLAEPIDAAGRGAQVVIEAEGKPPVKRVPVKAGLARHRRVFGQFAGQIRIKVAFGAPLAEDFWVGCGSLRSGGSIPTPLFGSTPKLNILPPLHWRRRL